MNSNIPLSDSPKVRNAVRKTRNVLTTPVEKKTDTHTYIFTHYFCTFPMHLSLSSGWITDDNFRVTTCILETNITTPNVAPSFFIKFRAGGTQQAVFHISIVQAYTSKWCTQHRHTAMNPGKQEDRHSITSTTTIFNWLAPRRRTYNICIHTESLNAKIIDMINSLPTTMRQRDGPKWFK